MTAPRRVRHLLKGLGPGGAERLVVAQATAGGPSVHDVVYLLPHKDHLVDPLTAHGVTTTCLASPSAARPAWLWRLRELLGDDPTDVLHLHSPAVAAGARLVVRSLPRERRPVLVGTEHNRWPRHHPLTRLANRLTIRLQQVTVAVSDDVRSTVRGVSAERIRTVVHGIDLDEVRAAADRDAVRAELGWTEGDLVLVCVANLRREKALEVLVEAARRATAEEPRLRYALVGQGPLADEVDRWVTEAGVADRFQLLGYRTDVPRILSGADVFTLSSRHEGLPVAVMEALALGLPVVATAAGGVPDAVGRGGEVTPVDDAAALADRHLALARDDVRRTALAEAAAAEAERFSVERAVAELEEIYDAAVAARG